jgi:uncharacterized membrane protein YsdA (DUF1294 family)/cold shock CspA family protein
MRYQGRLSNWNDDKGYGFVTPNGGGDKVFVHIKAFSDRRRRPIDGNLITYAVARDARNRLRAYDIRYPGQPKLVASHARPKYAAALIVLFGCVVTALAYLGKTPLLVPFVYVIVSIITLMAYGFDKSAAMNNRWRTNEGTLHLLSLVGGWPGALVAQQMFHHKSRKLEFKIVFWITAVLNCAALGWSVTDSGASLVSSVFGSP